MRFTSAEILADLGEWVAEQIGGTWSVNAVYRTSDPWPIFVGQIPPSDKLGNALCLNIYNVNRDRDNANPDVYVQIRVRGDLNPFTASGMAETLEQLLHDRERFKLANRTHVLLCQRVVRAPQAPDEGGRWHSVDSYRFTLNPS